MTAAVEPVCRHARPIDMRTATSSVLAVAGLLLTAALAGCGEQGEAPPTAARWHECDAAAFHDVADTLGRVDTGEGGTVVVKLGGETGPCAGGLMTLWQGNVFGIDVDRRDLDVSTAQVFRLPGGDHGPHWYLRVDSRRAGNAQGLQPHVFTLELAEVTTDTGDPLLPFVSTDTAMDPVSARCAGDARIQVFTAAASKPPGVVMAWDVERVTYLLDGDEAELQDRTQVRDHAADPVLRRSMPQLFDPASVLADCARPL